jgi:endoglucanase
MPFSSESYGLWLTLLQKSNDKVIFDIMNEPHTMGADITFNLNQAAVNAIRAAGATQQLILVEGTGKRMVSQLRGT